jgi:hypothetical protein
MCSRSNISTNECTIVLAASAAWFSGFLTASYQRIQRMLTVEKITQSRAIISVRAREKKSRMGRHQHVKTCNVRKLNDVLATHVFWWQIILTLQNSYLPNNEHVKTRQLDEGSRSIANSSLKSHLFNIACPNI